MINNLNIQIECAAEGLNILYWTEKSGTEFGGRMHIPNNLALHGKLTIWFYLSEMIQCLEAGIAEIDNAPRIQLIH